MSLELIYLKKLWKYISSGATAHSSVDGAFVLFDFGVAFGQDDKRALVTFFGDELSNKIGKVVLQDFAAFNLLLGVRERRFRSAGAGIMLAEVIDAVEHLVHELFKGFVQFLIQL